MKSLIENSFVSDECIIDDDFIKFINGEIKSGSKYFYLVDDEDTGGDFIATVSSRFKLSKKELSKEYKLYMNKYNKKVSK